MVLVPWKRNQTHRLVERFCNFMIVILSIGVAILTVVVLMNFAGIESQYARDHVDGVVGSLTQ